MSNMRSHDTRLVFRVYAVLTAVLAVIGLDGNAGVSLGAQFQLPFLVLHPTAASPLGQYVVPRLTGVVLLMAALIALAFASAPRCSHRCCPRSPSGRARRRVVLSSFAIVNARHKPSGQGSVDVLRSRYEAQIREAPTAKNAHGWRAISMMAARA